MSLSEFLFARTTEATLLLSFAKATIVLALAQVVVTAIPSISAARKHLVLCVALSSFLVIPLVSLFAPRWNVEVKSAVVSAAAPRTTATSIDPVSRPSQSSPTTINVPLTPKAATSFLPHLTTLSVLAIIWAIGALVLLGRFGVAMLRLHSIVDNANDAPAAIAKLLDETREWMRIEAPVRLLVSDSIAVPMIWGVGAGTLLLPRAAEEWSEEELQATIVHELGHLQRLDYVALGIMNLVAACFWFDPQIWTARRRALSEGEHACDDLVLRSGAKASDYASHLLSVARLMPRHEPLAAILAMSRPTQLEGRMFSILSPTTNRKPVGGKQLMISSASFMLLVAPFAAAQLAVPPAPPAPPAPPRPVIATAMVAIPEPPTPPAPPSGRHRSSHRLSINRNTGTCSDYEHDFNTNATATAEESKSYGGSSLDVRSSQNGGISVRRGSGSSFGVTVCKSAGAMSDSEANAMLSRITVSERNGVVTVDGPDSDDWSADLIVTMPDDRAITVNGSNGPVSVDDVRGRVDASVVNGPLSISNSTGRIKASAQNGPLSLAGGSGDVDIRTQNGPLTINLDGSEWNGGELRAHVDNGPLVLSVPKAYGSGVSVKTPGRGPFSCDSDLCRGRVTHDEYGAPTPIDTTIGSGPTRVYIEGGNGPVAIQEN